jgi:hypothetical protein
MRKGRYMPLKTLIAKEIAQTTFIDVFIAHV